MLQDIATNLAIIKQSEKIPLARKINILMVYLDHIELVFFADVTDKSPLEIQEAQRICALINRYLVHLVEANEDYSPN